MKIYGPRGKVACAALWLLGLSMLVASPWAASAQSLATAERRVIELRAEIARHDELYFKRAQPEIADADYDRLKQELQSLELLHPQLAGRRMPMGDDRSGEFPPARHRRRMLSLEKAYTEAEWRSFHARVVREVGRTAAGFVVEPKYDGLAISLTYERGRLVRAVTRGDGLAGDEVTPNLAAVRKLPRLLAAGGGPVPDVVELHGEIYVDNAEFTRINAIQEAEGEAPFAHPRNLAVGTLKSTDAALRATRRLSVVIHGWGAWDGAREPATEREFADQVARWGLPAVRICGVATSADGVWALVKEMDRTRAKLGFPVDGAVVKLDSVEMRQALGESEVAPRWAVACKFSPERAVARLQGISLQVGRTGIVTPVAEFDPVELGGAEVTRATLHNRREIARLDARVGDWIEIERAGEVVPAVERVVLERRPTGLERYEFPTACPSCRTPLLLDPGVVTVRCPNPRCPAQVQRRLEHFASRQAAGLKGFGPVSIAALVEAGRLSSPADFYRLDRDTLVAVKGIEGKAADRLLDGIEASKRTPLWRIIQGLSIPSAGPVTSRRLAARAKDLAGFARLSRVELVDLVGPAAGEAVADYLANEQNQADLRVMIAAGVGRHAGPVPRPELAGKVFVFTGALPGLTRAQAARLVEAAGGVVHDGVSQRTDYVVAGDGAGTKHADAVRLGVKVLSPGEFAALVDRP